MYDDDDVDGWRTEGGSWLYVPRGRNPSGLPLCSAGRRPAVFRPAGWVVNWAYAAG